MEVTNNDKMTRQHNTHHATRNARVNNQQRPRGRGGGHGEGTNGQDAAVGWPYNNRRATNHRHAAPARAQIFRRRYSNLQRSETATREHEEKRGLEGRSVRTETKNENAHGREPANHNHSVDADNKGTEVPNANVAADDLVRANRFTGARLPVVPLRKPPQSLHRIEEARRRSLQRRERYIANRKKLPYRGKDPVDRMVSNPNLRAIFKDKKPAYMQKTVRKDGPVLRMGLRDLGFEMDMVDEDEEEGKE